MISGNDGGIWASDNSASESYADRYNVLFPFPHEEIVRFLERLALRPDDVFVDFGCGAGAVLHVASRSVFSATGVDVCGAQVSSARDALKSLANVSVVQSSFLECSFPGLLFTKAVARKSLHHLTDPEKPLFFKHVGSYFQKQALFLIEDGIFSFPRSELDKKWPQIEAEAEKYYGDRWVSIRNDFTHTLKEEFPTGFDHWQKSLESGGFSVIEHAQTTCFYGFILARKD